MYEVEPAEEFRDLPKTTESQQRNRNLAKITNGYQAGDEPLIITTMRDRQVATGTYRTHVGRHNLGWMVGVWDMMQHIGREHGDRHTQVKQSISPDSIKDPLRLAQVGVHNSGIVVTDQQKMTLRHNPRVYIDVHHATTRIESLRHLVHVARSRQARSEIQELPHTRTHQIPHHTTQEHPIDAHHVRQMRRPQQDALSEIVIGHIVV